MNGEGETRIFKREIALHEKNAERDQPFTLNKHARERLDQWDLFIDAMM